VMRDIARVVHSPAVVIGSGIAGLTTALGLEECVLVTRGRLGSGSSWMAQGGIAAALAPHDAAAAHAADTIAVAGGIGDPLIADAVAHAAAGRIAWLESLGARFDRDEQGHLRLGQEAGHSERRIVHADGDATGAEAMRVLCEAVRARATIDVWAEHELVDLIRQGDCIVGALVASPTAELIALLAPAVVLATGGIGGLYARTTNPPELTGDGLAAAARAGAKLADLEFVQFHPTALDIASEPVPLLSEALRGEGAMLINDRGERFMPAVHPDAELAPRDIVARAIWHERQQGRRVFLDARVAVGSRFPERFPTIWRFAQAAGLDPRHEPLPVTPAEHYHMGGIATDAHGRSSLPGLWAVGEVATTGLHGANRLASNSLLEGMVFGARVSRAIRAEPLLSRIGRITVPSSALAVPTRGHRGAPIAPRVRALMWHQVGLVRNAAGLEAALRELRRMRRRRLSLTERNLALVGELIAAAALARAESRGAHWREDAPQSNDRYAARSFYRRRPAPSIDLPLPRKHASDAARAPMHMARRTR
jgi:L-aspartate oxidase